MTERTLEARALEPVERGWPCRHCKSEKGQPCIVSPSDGESHGAEGAVRRFAHMFRGWE